MSTEFRYIIYRTGEVDALHSFCQIVHAIQDISEAPLLWTPSRIGRGRRKRLSTTHQVSTEELIELAKTYGPQTYRPREDNSLWATTGLDFLTPHDNGTESVGFPVEIAAFGNRCLSGLERDFATDGVAQVYIGRVDSFRKVNDVAINHSWNKAVIANLDILRSILERLIQRVRPSAIRTLIDEGAEIAINSHCTYFDSPATVINDLNQLRKRWSRRSEVSDFPPMIELENYQWELNSRRSERLQRDVYREMTELVANCDHVTTDHVVRAIDETSLDTMPVDDGGYIVFNYPFFMDQFVDAFYAEVLRIAAKS